MARINSPLISGQILVAEDLLVSSNGQYAAYMQSDGNLVLIELQNNNHPYWSVGADESGGYVAKPVPGGKYFVAMQGDGNLVLYNGTTVADAVAKNAYWSSHTSGKGSSGWLEVQNDGNLSITLPGPGNSRTPIWNSHTSWVSMRVDNGVTALTTNQWFRNGTYLLSPFHKFAVLLQNDGNLVVFPTLPESPYTPDFSTPLWSVWRDKLPFVGQPHGGNYFGLMQNDGNFVLYNGTDPAHITGPYWATDTVQSAHGNFVFAVDDGFFSPEYAGGFVLCRGLDPTGDLMQRIYPYTAWMEVMGPRIANKPLYQMAIPGTHDSGTYGLDLTMGFAPDSDSTGDILDPLGATTLLWAKAQDHDIATQLNTGIRFFDLRIAETLTVPPGTNMPNPPWGNRIRIVHSLYGPLLADILAPIVKFVDAHPKELVILYFSTNKQGLMNNESWAGLAEYLKTVFTTKLAPQTAQGATVTPKELWDQHQQIILIWEDANTASANGFWFDGHCLDKAWYHEENPSLANMKAFAENALKARTDTNFLLIPGAIGATQTLILAGKFPNIDNSNMGHPKSLEDIAKQVTPAVSDWLRTDWVGLPWNIISCDFYELGNEVDDVLWRNTVT
ncbi:hypothetical protein ACFXHA_00420 [Nocardia sp. NPDC059240]|uniref:hypothetical protein n=1 Tax=Nocardia sp. NPDC059240 TaxID=3346786 RepID=UPI0036C836F9